MYIYCVSKKYWPILFSNLVYKMGHYFLHTVNIDIRNTGLVLFLAKVTELFLCKQQLSHWLIIINLNFLTFN